MPRVPYEPYPTAQPQGGGERVSVQTPGAAFGENIGQALEGLGTTTEKVGGELFQRAIALQELKNEAEARDAQTEYATKASLLHADFGALEGKAAADRLPGYLKDQADLRTSIRDRLSNPMVQRFYDVDTLPFMQRNVFSAAGHAADQNKKAIVGTAQATVDVATKTFVDPTNESEYNAKIDTVRSAAATIAGAHNWSPEQTQDYILTQTSKLRAAQITQIAHTDPLRALQMLDQNKEDMVQNDYDLTMDRVRAQNRAVGAVNLANSVYGDGTKPFQQMADEIKERSPALAHGDPIFEKDALTALRGKVFYDKSAQRDSNNTTSQEIWNDGILKGVKNVQELRNLPGMAEKIDSLPPKVQAQIPEWINRYNAARDKSANEENFTKLMGMSYTDREGFLNTDLSAQNVSQAQMRRLMAVRAELIRNPRDDPRVGKALDWMKTSHASELQALGIYGRDKNNPDQYDHYVGAMQSAIDAWTQDKGKPPSYKELTEEIGPSIIKQRSGSHFWNSNRAFFDQDLPEGWGQDLIEEAQRRGEPPPTNEELYRAYVRSLFLELYKGSSGAGPAVPQSR